MKAFRRLTLLLPFALVFAGYFQAVNAQTWDKNTKITFSGPVQVPGKVLPAGTYYFKLYNSPSNRHIVRIFKNDQSTLVTTILAIPNYRLEPKGKTVLTFSEHPANEPEALSAWFYPGDNFGQQFLYPKSKAAELSRLNNEQVPSTESEETYPADTKDALQAENTASQQPLAAAPQSQYSSTTPASATTSSSTASQDVRNQQLPATASLTPLIALLGFILLTVAVVLRKTVRA
jgi:hypothetical protein